MHRLSARKRLIALLLPAAMLLMAGCGESDRDETAPLVTLATDLQTVTPRQADTVDLAGTIEEGATLEVLVNETATSGVTVAGETWTAAVDLREGSNLITVTASDSAGNTNTIRFSIVRDNAAPTATSPFADTPIAVTLPLPIALFGEAMNEESVKANTTVTRIDGGEAPAGEIVYTAGMLTAFFAPAENFTFAAGATYVVNLGEGITDLAGNPLPAQSFSFTTAP